jgi:hypothetical protein
MNHWGKKAGMSVRLLAEMIVMCLSPDFQDHVVVFDVFFGDEPPIAGEEMFPENLRQGKTCYPVGTGGPDRPGGQPL